MTWKDSCFSQAPRTINMAQYIEIKIPLPHTQIYRSNFSPIDSEDRLHRLDKNVGLQLLKTTPLM